MDNISCVNEKDCFGCTACYSICPTQAISMKETDKGFIVPLVDDDMCIGCGKCAEACPSIVRWNDQESSIDCYAYTHNDRNELQKSTSGGLFNGIIQQFPKANICGCVRNNNIIEHVVSDNFQTISRMGGSKYVQSNLGEVFKTIKEKLALGERVIFSGTSCQVDGLQRYLSTLNVTTDNLLTLDLVCHGVPSPRVYWEYIHFYEKIKRKKVIDHYFRNKTEGWGLDKGVLNYIQTIVTTDGSDSESLEANLWQNVFFSDLCTRESCFSCPYSTTRKPSDITMGDFWGIEKIDKSLKDVMGCSLCIIHTEKGERVIKQLNATPIDKGKYNTITSAQARLRKPVARPQAYEKFWDEYLERGFGIAAKKYFRYSLKYKLMNRMYKMSKRMRLTKVPKYLLRKIYI